jgi:hypothetical protein
MTKKRRHGRLASTEPVDPSALRNEVLSLLFGAQQGPVESQIRRVRQRHPALSEHDATQVVCECRQVLETGYAMVSAALAQGESQVHVVGRIMQLYPWITSRNTDTLCERSFLLAR